MTNMDADDVKVLFSLFDVDGNGQLKGNEIRDLISLIGGSHVNDEDLAKVTQFIDTNGDGSVSIDEFETKVLSQVPMASLNVKSLFQSFDLNGDGFVDENEFNEVIAKKSDSLNQRRINFFRKILTKENGGQVSYQEFLDNTLKHYRNFVANVNN